MNIKIIGVMSGSSCDGVDVVLIEIDKGPGVRYMNMTAYETFAYTERFREKLLRVQRDEVFLPGALRVLDVTLAHIFGDRVCEFLEKRGIPIETVHLIGSHGHTISHHPPGKSIEIPATWQIGDPAIISVRTGISTIGDFRVQDLELGGQGAPLVPLTDFLLLGDDDETRIALNIGGIANLSVIPKKAELGDVYAFDSGPGNCLIDRLVLKATGGKRNCDQDGEVSRRGKIIEPLLERMLRHPYFSWPFPKSANFLNFLDLLREMEQEAEKGAKYEDVIRTAVELTARTIISAGTEMIKKADKPARWIVSGGGIHNPVLMKSLRAGLHPVPVESSSRYNLDPDAKEAIAFAIQARETWFGRPGNCPGATGARAPAILGKICLAAGSAAMPVRM